MFFFVSLLLIIYSISTKEQDYNIERNTNEVNKDEMDNTLNINPIFQEFNEKWEEKMSTFVSQYMYIIHVKYKSQEEYYENITNTPCIFRGAFILDEAKTQNDVLDFKIIAPNNSVIFEETSAASVFSLNLTDKGLYTILFHNRILNKDVRPILMINSGQNVILEKEKLSETEKKLDSIMSFLKKFEQDTILSRGYKRRGKEELSKTNKYFYVFSIIETIVLIGVSIWQYFYLKHLFEVKGSL